MANAQDIIRQAQEHMGAGRGDQARVVLARGVQKFPNDLAMAREYGMLIFAQGQMDAGIYYLERAVQGSLTPGPQPDVAAMCALAVAKAAKGLPHDAALWFRKAVETQPDYLAAHSGLGLVLMALDDYDGALVALRRSVELAPATPGMRGNLAMCLLDMARPEEAVACLRDGLLIDSTNRELRLALPFVSNYLQDVTPEHVFKVHQRAGESLPEDQGAAIAWKNSPDPERAIRIGFLSSDLREHSVTYFLEPILEKLDQRSFDIVCYSLSRREDATTRRLKGYPITWKSVGPLGEADLAHAIRQDQIDLLVELSGLTSGHRAGTIARRAAPVQITAIGYPSTTGIPAMDHRIVDAVTDPAPQADAYATEKLVRVPGCFLCYKPPTHAPAIAPLPARRTGHVTFGSFNALKKMNETTMRTWASVLQAVPGSRLIVKSVGLATPSVRERMLALIQAAGVNADRVELLGRTATAAEHLELYNRIDIALDTYPYNGTTTTCEALWMGVPVVASFGAIHASRVSASLLTAINATDWIAPDQGRVPEVAKKLASDLPALEATRASLRERVASSSLCDETGYAAKIGAAYRDLWRAWCTKQTARL